MQFCTLGLILLLSSTVAFGQGRAPAVEDFVGIEVDHPEQTPPGTEALFNFEKDINRFEETQASANPNQKISQEQITTPINWSSTFALAFALGLPLVSWVLIMSHLRRKATEASQTNIRVFEDYKRERQAKKQAEEEIRKVS